jgi:hypothetical protein
MRKHAPAVPPVVIGQATVSGGLDRATIRRYIMRRYEQIRYCYDKQLLAHPNISGEVEIRFLITPNGTVQGSNGAAGAGMDHEVASCAADIIGSIAFPAPGDGGGVQVNFPLTFHNTHVE